MARRRSDAGVIARKSHRNNTLGRLWRAVAGLWDDRALRAASRIESLEPRQLLSSGTIAISEIMYHPGYGDPGDAGYIAEDTSLEYIELYNQGPAAVNLNGWHFNQGVDYTFGDVTMNAGDYLVVAADVNAFQAKYPNVSNVVGGWTGKLANNGEDIELENNLGQRDDFVSYSNQGDWAQRRIGEMYPGQPSWWRGWDWSSGADGGLKSLELINLNAPNEYGQNWAASIPNGGTPGQPNSVAAADIAPLIDKVQHSPAIPKSTDPVTVTARLIDELPTGTNATLRWRTDGSTTFNSVQMYDDGQHGDGIANDGTWGATIPAQPNQTIVEFYVEANDAAGHVRTWPAPTDAQGTQGANALYQVDDTVYSGDQPIYRLVIPQAEWNAWYALNQPNSTGRYSNAAMNGTFIAVDSTGTEVRYNAGIRNRGAGTRADIPHNFRVDIPADRPFEGVSSIDFNTQYVESQVAGNAIFLAAGLPSHYGAAVQMRVNGQNLAKSGSPQFGSYYRMDPYDSEWVANHMPDDPDGNIYKGVWYFDGVSLSNGGANLAYLGSSPSLYQQLYSPNGPTSNTGAYTKQTNNAENDWSDLIHMLDVLNNAPAATYAQDVAQVINIDEWLRYFAVNSLIGNGETTLGTGAGDDYSMIAGKVDGRFQLLNHDMDTVLGRHGGAPVDRSIWYAADHLSAINKFLRNPQIAPRYIAVLKELINTVFSPAQLNPMLDNLLGGWVPQSDIDSMKSAAASRVANVLSQIAATKTTIAGGTLASSVWTAANGPYYISGSITIPAGATLTIEPGTSVYLASGANITVADGGRLLALGSPVQPILFSHLPGSSDSWGGITVNGSANSPETRIAYAHIEYNGSTAIHSTNGTVFLDHLTFGTTTHQYVSLDSSSFVVQDCTFPTSTASFELLHGTGGIKAGGRGIFLRNFFGATNGYNDSIDFSGGNRPGPIVQFIDNVFMGASDDNLDLDSTDAWVEGNIFMHIHKNGSPDTASAVSGGADNSNTSEVTIINNLFYDVDHVANAKQGDFFTLINNTVVHQNHAGGLDTEGALVCMQDNGMAEARGMYLEGNIAYDLEALVRGQVSSTVTFVNNLMSLPWSGPGAANTVGDPLFVHLPTMNETNFTSWEEAQIMWQWLSLQPASPAIASGPNGTDKGAVVPPGVSISGEPVGDTSQTSATLTVGVNRTGFGMPAAGWPNGCGFVAYRWRLDGGAWSDETPIGVPISLTGLADGTHQVDVVGKSDAGWYQNDPIFGSSGTITSSRIWTVGSPLPTPAHVILNEVLAHNVSIAHNGVAPDMIELYNDGGTDADLSGMILTDDPANPLGHRFTFPAGTTLAKGAYLTLYADNLVVPGEFHLGFNLAGEGDTVALLNPDGTTADSVTYGVQIPDLSIGRDAAGNWTLNTPTLGEANQTVPLGDPASVKINEWLAAEKILFENDFVELYNTGSLPVNLGGYYFTDNPVDMAHMAQFNPAMAAGYRLPPLSFIAADGYRSFTADGNISQGGDHVNFSLDHVDGLIALMDPFFKLVDQVVYDPQKLDVSEGRNPGADATFSSETIPTPGIENTGVTRIVGGTVTTMPIFDIASGTQKWSWWDKGSLPAGAWTEPGYVEIGWGTNGAAMFWNKSSDTYPEAKRTQVAVQANGRPYQTYYYRTHFNFSGDVSRAVSIDLRTIVDDGAVIYLNGQEVLRIAMPQGAISYSTLASRTVGTATYENYSIDLTKLPAGTLRQGDNVLAVEVHQCQDQSNPDTSKTSSDMAWGTTLNVKSADVSVRQVEVPANIQALMNQLRITELMYDPIGGNTYEYIELKNNGSTAIDLTGVRIGGGVDFTFPQKMVDGVAQPYMLGPGEYVIVASDVAAFTSRYGSSINLAGQYTGHFNGKGENIVLRLPDPWEAAMLRFDYKPSWYPSADGNGHSLVIIDPSAPQASWPSKSSWRPSIQAGGSPGAVDQGTAAGAVVINEVMPYTSDLTRGQWIEIRNTTSEPFDISNWYVSDDLSNLAKYRIPANTVIPAGGFYTLTELDFNNPANPNCLTPFTFSATGGGVYLSSTNADGTVGDYRESAAFGPAELNVSFGRYTRSNGQSDFVALSQSTFGDINASPKIGPVIINEVMYHPPAGGDEFIELYNSSDSDVALSDGNGNGWKIDAVGFTFAEGDVIPAHQYALVVPIAPADFRAKYNIPAGVKIFGPYLGELDNGGEYLALTKPGVAQPAPLPPAYVLVDAVGYNDVAPWPTSPDGNGPSLVRLDPTQYGNDLANWGASGYGGSPGQPNSGDSTAPTVSISPIDPSTSVGSISLVFSEPVMGLDVTDLVLTRGSSTNLLGSDQSLTTTDGGKTWLLSGLRGLSFVAGDYNLTLSPGGITDLAGNALASGASASFAVSSTSLSGTSSDDSWTLSIDGSNLVIAESHMGEGPTLLFTVPLSDISALSLNGLEGNDSVSIDSALPFAPLFNGGAGSNTLAISAGSYSFSYDIGAGQDLWLSLAGDAATSFAVNQHLHDLALADSARASLLGGHHLIRTSGLSLAGNGTLDLNDGSLIVQSDEQHRQSMLDSVARSIASARGGESPWSGPGITSSAAANNELLGLAAMVNLNEQGAVIRAELDGEAVDTSSILVKCTFNGDADLNGILDGSDYFFIDKGFLSRNLPNPPSGYRNGDFDYNGLIDGSDYFLIDKAFLSQGSAAAAAPLAASAAPAAPKPASSVRSLLASPRKRPHARPHRALDRRK